MTIKNQFPNSTLVILNRKWYLGTDDYCFVSLFTLVFDISCITLLIFDIKSNTNHSYTVIDYIYISLWYIFFIIHLFSLYNSLTTKWVEKNHKLALLYIPLSLIISISLLIIQFYLNQFNISNILFYLSCTYLSLHIFFIFLMQLYFSSNISNNKPNNQHFKLQHKLSCLLYCSGFDEHSTNEILDENILDSISSLIQETLTHPNNHQLVFSDIFTGLLLLKAKQKLIKQSKYYDLNDNQDLQLIYQENKQPVLSLDHINRIENAYYYADFAYASYGILLKTYDQPCHLFSCNNPCCYQSNNNSDPKLYQPNEAELDDIKCCNKTGLSLSFHTFLKEIELKHQAIQVISCNLISLYGRSVFYLCLDHDKQAIILAIRGTLSIADTITDLHAKSMNITLNNQQHIQVHSGIYTNALNLKHLIQHKLHELITTYPTYNFILSGHSLGAATATILTLLYH